VCVLEVLYPKESTSSTASKPAPPKKRQRSMLDYASQGTKGGAGGAAGTGSAALSRGMERRYLMVQRPEGSGLLAGLWEFPGLSFACASALLCLAYSL